MNNRGPCSKKSKNLQTDRKAHILGDKGPACRPTKVEKDGNLWCPSITCCSLFSHYNKISLADLICKYPAGTDTMRVPSRLNKGKNSSFSWEGEVGMKIRKYYLKPHPPQWKFHSFISTLPITNFPKNLRAVTHLSLSNLPLRVYYSSINPCLAFLTPLSHFWILSVTKIYSH